MIKQDGNHTLNRMILLSSEIQARHNGSLIIIEAIVEKSVWIKEHLSWRMYRTGEGLTTSDKLGSVSLCDSTKFNAFKGSVEVTEIFQMSLH